MLGPVMTNTDHSGLRKIYVCSPLRGADSEATTISADTAYMNQQAAREYCRYVVKNYPRCIPIAPHIYLTQFLDDDNRDDRKLALDIDRLLIGDCDELWVFGVVVSDGMAAEISEAARVGIPIRWFTRDCVERCTQPESHMVQRSEEARIDG